MMGSALNAAAQSRRIVTLGGFRVKVVDIHAHCDILDVAPLLEGTSMADANLNRPLGPEWLARMDSRGIDVAAISTNRFWWYEAEPDLARRIVRLHDDKIAQWCNAHSDRCVQLSSPALQFPELAAEQLEYAVKELGAKGASVLGHARGRHCRLRSMTRSGRRSWSSTFRSSCTRMDPGTSFSRAPSAARAASAISWVIRSRPRCSWPG